MNFTIPFLKKKPSSRTFDISRRSFIERMTTDAYTGWAAILFLSALIAVTLVAASARVFLAINTGGMPPESSSSTMFQKAGFDPEALSNLLSVFEERASTTAALEQSFAGPPDPSL